jgi:hypothetical protein
MTSDRVKRVVLVATTTGYQIRSFGEAAAALGVRLLFASDRCDRLEDPWFDEAVAVRFDDDRGAIEAVARACGDTAPDGVLAVGDRPTVLAAHLNAWFGLPGHPPAAAAASRNKRATRMAFREAGLPVPAFRDMPIDDRGAAVADGLPYPLVIKPLALSGSRGVMRVDDSRQFVEACARLRALLRAPDIRVERDPLHDRLLVETFIPGREYAVEGVLTCGMFQPFAIFDKPDPLDGPFFEETIYVTPSRLPAGAQQQIVDTVAAAVRALGLWHGPIHAECRVNDSGVYVLEVAARPIGGLCSKALRFAAAQAEDASSPSTGGTASLEEVLLRHALGEDVSAYRRERQASAVMMVPIPRRGVYRDVAGVDEARMVAGIDDVRITAKRDALVVPLPEGRSYLGFIFAHAGDAEGAETALREAHSRLAFQIDRDLPLRAR